MTQICLRFQTEKCLCTGTCFSGVTLFVYWYLFFRSYTVCVLVLVFQEYTLSCKYLWKKAHFRGGRFLGGRDICTIVHGMTNRSLLALGLKIAVSLNNICSKLADLVHTAKCTTSPQADPSDQSQSEQHRSGGCHHLLHGRIHLLLPYRGLCHWHHVGLQCKSSISLDLVVVCS